ncbi:UDP:flavonoid glycosyltransferase YjiC, YdhE family [Micromonospora eburnea]|uniref:UDP:flavonoid glycosyltransferase YjiC, YdhE family n=1 Tax=Micromonospora eburnea TaxID=227316 RepID=A0A1C6V0Y4_9ACTN|nr:UDP:flavonoid glycosyltransferase YjiC, YdhE family [Micromonospora eburnea]
MRVLFVPLAAAGHYYAMVPLAWALRAAGHDVRVVGEPATLGMIERSGLTALPVAGSSGVMTNIRMSVDALRQETGKSLADFGDLESMPPDVRQRFKELRREAFAGTAASMADELVHFAHYWRPNLVVTDPVMFAGPLVAAVAGVPVVRHLSGPLLPTAGRSLGDGLPVERWPASLRALFDRFGAEARPDPMTATVDPCPPMLMTTAPPNRIGMRYVPYNGSGAMPGWLRRPATRPRVCVSWSMSNTASSGDRNYPAAVISAALRDRGMDVVVTVKESDRANLGRVPDGVRVASELPLQLVVPSCAAAVNHGGGGTSLTVVTHGVPQVMTPQDPAHVVHAERISAVGAGVAHRTRPIDVAAIADAVESMVSDDRWRTAARKVQEDNSSQPSPLEAVRELENLVTAGSIR